MASSNVNPAAELYNSPDLSDVDIKQIKDGQVREYYGHKAILSLASPYFLKMLAGPFKEATATVIELHGDDPAIFEILLKYIYHSRYDYELAQRLTSDETDLLRVLSDLSSMADKYNMRNLDQDAFDHMVEILRGSNDPDFTKLKCAIEWRYSSETAFRSYGGYRLTAIAFEPQRQFVETSVFDELIESHPRFAVDVVRAAQDTHELCVKTLTCGRCSRDVLIGRDAQVTGYSSFYCIFCGYDIEIR